MDSKGCPVVSSGNQCRLRQAGREYGTNSKHDELEAQAVPTCRRGTEGAMGKSNGVVPLVHQPSVPLQRKEKMRFEKWLGVSLFLLGVLFGLILEFALYLIANFYLIHK